MPWTYSGSSLPGLVSSRRRLQRAAEFGGDAEVQADRLGVADVQVAVGFGREARAHGRLAAGLDILADDLADEVLYGCGVARHRALTVGGLQSSTV